MAKVHSSGRTHGNNYPLLMIWKASTQSSLSYSKTTSKMLRIFGSQLKKGNPGGIGKPEEHIYRSRRRSTFYRGRNACNIGKFQVKKDRTYLYGATPPLKFSRSKRLTIYKEILQTRSPTQSGAKSGNLFSGPRSPFFYGSQLKTASSLGTTFEREAS
jgi:hypothetical protein